jgi:hypothetical protein
MPRATVGCSATIGNTRVLANIMRLFANNVHEGNIQFHEGGISISGMDQSHVCLIRCNLTEDTMMYRPPASPISFGVSFAVMSKILSAFSNASCTTLKPHPEKSKLEVFVMTPKGENQFLVNQMDIDEDELEVPEMEYEITRDIDTSTIKDSTDQADKLGAESIVITRNSKNEMRMSYRTDFLEGNVLIAEGGEEEMTENEVSIATAYLKSFISIGPFGPKTQVCYDQSYVPVRVKCPLISSSGELSTNDFVEIHIAPRVNDDIDDVEEDDGMPENVREY